MTNMCTEINNKQYSNYWMAGSPPLLAISHPS